MADEATMRADFAKYMDSDGLLTPTENPPPNSTGNGILYTAFMYMTYKQYGFLTDTDKTNYSKTLTACQVNGNPGLYNRAPGKFDLEAPDDYIGLVASSATQWTDLPYATDVLNYGKSTSYLGLIHYIYNNVSPGTFSIQAWYGRQPQLPAHFAYSAGVTPAFWRQVWWALTIGTSGMKTPTDPNSWTLSWLLLSTAPTNSFISKTAAKIWYQRFSKAFPGGMKDVFSTYFQNPNHPLALYFIDTLPILGNGSSGNPLI